MTRSSRHLAWACVCLLTPPAGASEETPRALDGEIVTIAIEAEHFSRQTKDDMRRWYVTSAEDTPPSLTDGDPSHHQKASGGAYVECLPDTRRTHSDKLVVGENFSNKPGEMGNLDYRVNFPASGRYYVWVRAFSTGSEDNGVHVGLDGEWPETGARLQWCEGKHGWRWESKQRTAKKHCGEPHKIYLDVADAGEHVVSFSMREDGFEFDKFILTTDRGFRRPEDAGPAAQPEPEAN